MHITLFVFALGLPIALTLSSMAYLRPILCKVLTSHWPVALSALPGWRGRSGPA
jgi:hypothetical protein